MSAAEKVYVMHISTEGNCWIRLDMIQDSYHNKLLLVHPRSVQSIDTELTMQHLTMSMGSFAENAPLDCGMMF